MSRTYRNTSTKNVGKKKQRETKKTRKPGKFSKMKQGISSQSRSKQGC